MKRLVPAVILIALAAALYFVLKPTGVKTVQSVAAVSKGLPSLTKDMPSVPSLPNVTTESGKPVLAPNQDPQTVSTSSPEEAQKLQSSSPASPEPVSQQHPTDELAVLAEELDNVRLVIRDYRNVVGENPTGSNSEITKALMGDNPRQVKMALPPGSRVSENGELSDRWGSAYFFHQLSSKEMEVRSAGPDQKMWTGDDVVAR